MSRGRLLSCLNVYEMRATNTVISVVNNCGLKKGNKYTVAGFEGNNHIQVQKTEENDTSLIPFLLPISYFEKHD